MKKVPKRLTATTNKSGFTLVELLLYFALVSILLVTVGSMFISIMEGRSTISSVTSLDRDGQFISMRLQYDLRRADSVQVPELSGESSAVLELAIDGQTITYQETNGQLLLTQAGESAVLHDQTIVDMFQVTRMGSADQTPLIQVRLELRSVIEEQTGPRSRIFETSVGLR
ncbi:MAG: prepilin-type N-terminal cleavage/methylation domain-containing protein [Patescibacteria group bacterium]